jgi:hypothetical protein
MHAEPEIHPPQPVRGGEEEDEILEWMGRRVRQMVDDGWTLAELADVGIREPLLRRLGLWSARSSALTDA